MKMKANFKKRRFFTLLFYLGFLLAITCTVLQIIERQETFTKLYQSEALDLINDGKVETVMLSDDEFLLVTEEQTYRVNPNDSLTFTQQIYSKGIEINTYEIEAEPLFIWTFIKYTLIIGTFLLILQLITGINKVKVEASDKDNISKIMKGMSPDTSLNIKKEIPDMNLDMVKGIDEVKRDVQGLISYLQNPYKYSSMGARMPKGTMLYGPPGTGKTMVAKAIAGTANVPFYSVSGSDFMQMYVGVGAKRVRELFDEANKNAPCIVFIDEIDAIGGQRGQSQSSERDQTINALLTEMDGFNSTAGVMVIAATNRLDMLDNALLRAGRFDKHVAVPLPDKKGREAILRIHAENKKFDETVDFKEIASQTTSFSGAALESLLNEATIIAVNNKKKFVSKKDIDRAWYKIIMQGDVKDGQEERHKKELELVAWHEAGHALVTKLLTNEKVSKVTILASTSGAGGVTIHEPEEGSFKTKTGLKSSIAVSYGGRAAEEILFNSSEEVTVGASSDIQSASKQIRDYIMKYGMSEQFGMLDISVFENHSASNDEIVKEASTLANEIYKETLNLLKDNKETLRKIAESLLENESLFDDDLNRIISGEDYEQLSLNL